MRKSRREWARERDQELVEEAIDFDEVPIQRIPMRASLRCRSCGHQGRALVPHGATSPRFKCSRCGSSLVAYSL